MSAASLQPQTSLSPSMQIIMLQLCNLVMQNVSNETSTQEHCAMLHISNVNNAQVEKFIAKLEDQVSLMEKINGTLNHVIAQYKLKEGVLGKQGYLEDFMTKKPDTCDDLREGKNEKDEKVCAERQLQMQKDSKAIVFLRLQSGDTTARLMAAAHAGYNGALQILIDIGVNVSVQDSDGKTPLQLAASRGHASTVQILLDAGASSTVVDAGNKTLLHLAAMGGHSDTVVVLHNAGLDVHARDAEGRQPLLLAVLGGYNDTVQVLLHFGATLNDIFYYKRNSNLYHLAAIKGLEGMIKILQTIGNVNWLDYSGSTPLHLAAQGGFVNVCRELISIGASIDLPDHSGLKALHLAAQRGHLEVCRLLLDSGANVNESGGRIKRTALHLAAFGNHATVVKLLLERSADPSIKDNLGRIPLDYACITKRSDVVNILLEADGRS